MKAGLPIKQPDLHRLRPYGDTTDDGMVQLQFTLPVPLNEKTKEAAFELVEAWGFEQIRLVHLEEVGVGFTWVVAYGRPKATIDYEKVEVKAPVVKRRSYKEIDKDIAKYIGRPIRVVGATTGFDTHTVGLDAILSMKGFAGDVGLERYQNFEVCNMGSQVPTEKLIDKALEFRADVILVSKVVSQKDIHITDLKDLLDKLERRGLADKFILIAGGPSVTQKLALELGFDAGFSVGTLPCDVADFILQKMIERKRKKER